LLPLRRHENLVAPTEGRGSAGEKCGAKVREQQVNPM
jgi:hypothetical protein